MTTRAAIYLQEATARLGYAILCFTCLLCACSTHADVLVYLVASPSTDRLVCTNLTEALGTHLQLALYASLYCVLPYWVYSVWAFTCPGFFTHEKHRLAWIALCACSLLFGSLYMSSLYGVPSLAKFLLGYTTHTGLLSLDMHPRISSYLSVWISVVICSHACVCVPLVCAFFHTRPSRRWMYLFCILGTACVCPPDPVMQGLLCLASFGCAEMCLMLSSVGWSYRVAKMPAACHFPNEDQPHVPDSLPPHR